MAERLQDFLAANLSRYEHHGDPRKSFPHDVKPGQAVCARHVEVEDDQIHGLSACRQIQRLVEGLRLAHLDVGLELLEIELEGASNQIGLVGKQDMHRLDSPL